MVGDTSLSPEEYAGENVRRRDCGCELLEAIREEKGGSEICD